MSRTQKDRLLAAMLMQLFSPEEAQLASSPPHSAHPYVQHRQQMNRISRRMSRIHRLKHRDPEVGSALSLHEVLPSVLTVAHDGSLIRTLSCCILPWVVLAPCRDSYRQSQATVRQVACRFELCIMDRDSNPTGHVCLSGIFEISRADQHCVA